MEKTLDKRIQLYIPEDMKLKIEDKAAKLGVEIGRKGNVSGYIRLLIVNDLDTMSPVKINLNVSDDVEGFKGPSSRVNVTIDEDLLEQARERAKSLGFIWGGKGNLSGYVKHLISSSFQ